VDPWQGRDGGGDGGESSVVHPTPRLSPPHGRAQRRSPGLLTLNLVYLAFVVLVPFTTDVLGDYSDTTEAVVLYAATLGCVAVVNWLSRAATIATQRPLLPAVWRW